MIKHIFNRIKSIVIILLTVSFLTSSMKVYADEGSNFKKSYNVVHQAIDTASYLILPTIEAGIGGFVCGPWCALVGGSIGAVDNALVYFGYTNERYLSRGFFGLAVNNLIYDRKPPSGVVPGMLLPLCVLPTHIVQENIGAIVGMLLPTALQSEVISENTWAIAPAFSALTKSKSGIAGMIYAGADGVFDELAIANGYSDKHYLTFMNVGSCLIGGTSLQSIIGPRLADFVGAGIGLLVANWEEDIYNNFMSPKKVAVKEYETMSKFIPKNQLKDHFEQEALAVLGTQIFIRYLSLKEIDYEQTLTYAFEHLDNPVVRNFGEKTLWFAAFIVPYGLSHIATDTVNSFYNKKLYYTLEDNVKSELYSRENLLHLTSNNNATVLLDNLKDDISTMVSSGNSLATNAVSSSIKGACGFGMLIFKAPNLATYNILYNQVLSSISTRFAKQERKYEEINKKLNSDYNTMVKHDNKNMGIIMERGGINFTRDREQELQIKIRENEGIMSLWSMANNVWNTINMPLSFILNFYTVANEINAGRIPFEDRTKAQYAVWQASNLLSWQANHAESISKVEQSLDRIIVLEGIIRTSEKSSDQINRLTKEGDQLVLKNLEIGVNTNKRLLFTADEITLDKRKVYAVTGKPGSGKSSLLAKIKGISAGFTYAKGEIIYPLINDNDPKVAMMSQANYFPLNISLKEALLYPNKFPSDPLASKELKQKMLTLLREAFAFSSPDTKARIEKLDTEIRDISTCFSGGEQKLLLLISIILQEPDIVLLDEVFTGLGEFTPIAQKLIKEYLPNALILSIDHEAAKHDHDFYDVELHITDDKKLILQPLIAKSMVST